MPAGPKTTWTDLANLGWYKNDIFNALNSRRGGTMRNLDDMALNERYAEKWGWYCYNALRDDLRADGPVFNDLPNDDTIVWEYDNTQDSEPYEDTWTESWTDRRSASVMIKQSASISLTSSISIEGVCNTEFGFTIDTESDKEETQEEVHELSHTWPVKVNPGEKLSIVRTESIRLGSQTYYQNYGLDPEHNLIATDGNPFNGHYYLGEYANSCLNNPKGTMTIVGTMKKVTFTFTIVRVDKEGKQKHEPLFMPPSPLAAKDESKVERVTVNNPVAKAEEEKEPKTVEGSA